ncbi:MAG TPA: hypothetical protein VIY48_06870, partial [Candidatus Paceibacterota bacterium]
MMDTILLRPDTWDMVVDANGNIAMATNPYSQAQDIASACRTFLGEVYYNNALGVPYFQSILGKIPTIQLVNSELQKAALTVPDVVDAVANVIKAEGRGLTGEMKAT